ncbi:unnamed protein product [Echinostoma caproni]|uniref:Amiloride-sensitive sodium channel n=1 Tax=Echinostoma caproni TaxID=27848 RepID=A0A183B659_9TREM|nr:unnamed protein product [Echinostoma caproni]
MELRILPRLESRNTEEFLPTNEVVEIQESGEDTDTQSNEPVQTSRLPYYIARHRKMADSCFEHARSKEHGLKHLDLRKGFLALFWIGVFLLVMSVLISMITGLVQSYLAMPVATQIKAEQDVFEFPDVSICAKSPFYMDRTQFGQNSSAENILNRIQSTVLNKLRDASVKVTTAAIQSALLIQMATRQDDTLLRAYQHILYCRYDDKECSFYNFTELVHLRYVQCFTFSPRTRLVSGGKGLQLIFYKQRGNSKPFLMLNDLEDPTFTDDINDGIHVLVHNPNTFPTYEISNMPTSFSLRYGQQATVEVFGLKYRSDLSGRKSCIIHKAPYRYTNFRGGANFLEYRYTYEDCVANKKQTYFKDRCGCYSDRLFVPFNKAKSEMERSILDANRSTTEFCRDIRQKTSQRLREEFLCFDQYDKMPTTAVLDQYIPLNLLFETRDDLDARKIERHAICSLPCEKTIYATRFFEVTDMEEGATYPPTILSTYVQQLQASQLEHAPLQRLWEEMFNESEPSGDNYRSETSSQYSTKPTNLNSRDMVILDIRTSTEMIDAWEEELTDSLFNLISNLGGTLGLCAGISFLSSFFLLIFFGRAFVHAVLSAVFWFWWAVYLGRPAAVLPTKSPGEWAEKEFAPANRSPENSDSSDEKATSEKDIDYFSDVNWKIVQGAEPKVAQAPTQLEGLNPLRQANPFEDSASEVGDTTATHTQPVLSTVIPALARRKSKSNITDSDASRDYSVMTFIQ